MESVCTVKRTEGSNPSLSANHFGFDQLNQGIALQCLRIPILVPALVPKIAFANRYFSSKIFQKASTTYFQNTQHPPPGVPPHSPLGLLLPCITNLDERIVGFEKIFFKIRVGFYKEASYHIDQCSRLNG